MKTNEKYPISHVYLHPEHITVDLAGIARNMSENEFNEFYPRYIRAVAESKNTPYRGPKSELRYDLQDWLRIDYFSVKRPVPGMKPDYRFIYKYDLDNKAFYKLATGLRNAKGLDANGNKANSVYYTAKQRNKSPEVFKLENELDE